MGKSTALQESVIFEAIPPDRVDREAGIVKGVRVLGEVSRNNRRYTESAMRDAVRLYENLGVKLDHPDKDNPHRDRSVLEGFGELRNVRLDPMRNAIYADHHYPTSHKFADSYAENCVRFPNQLGFSHNAQGDCRFENDWQIVESLTDAISVDVVDRPATNKGIFESEDRTMANKREIKTVVESAKTESLTKTLLLEQMEAGVIAPDLAVEEPLEGETEDDSIKAAFRAAVMAVFDDDRLDADATKAAIEKIIDTSEEVNNGPSEEEGDMEASGSATVESLQAELTAIKTENEVRRLLEGSTIDVDDGLVESLIPLTSDQRKRLIERLESHKPAPRRPERPQRSAPVRESRSNDYGSRWDSAVQKAGA